MAKIRTDFVTNSSSSSFIIGKKDDTHITIDFVYQIMRELFSEYIEKSKKVIEYIKEHPSFCLKIEERDNYCSFAFFTGNADYIFRNKVAKHIEEKFNFDIYDDFLLESEWLSCDTYSEYEAYWREKDGGKNYCHYAPFTICDFFENKEIYYPHKNEIRLHRSDIYSSTLDWYYPSAEQAFKRITDSYYCEKCYRKKYCDEEECNATLDKFLYIRPREEEACLDLLGRAVILSESGKIPFSIVEELRTISEFACNHMG